MHGSTTPTPNVKSRGKTRFSSQPFSQAAITLSPPLTQSLNPTLAPTCHSIPPPSLSFCLPLHRADRANTAYIGAVHICRPQKFGIFNPSPLVTPTHATYQYYRLLLSQFPSPSVRMRTSYVNYPIPLPLSAFRYICIMIVIIDHSSPDKLRLRLRRGTAPTTTLTKALPLLFLKRRSKSKSDWQTRHIGERLLTL